MTRRLCGLFAVDLRSLAAFRIAVGTILLIDVAIRAGDFSAHYTEAGVLPLAALRETLGESTWRWSLYTLSPTDCWAAALLGLTALCGGLLVLGWWTRVATAAAWVLVLSVHNRVPVIINAGDTLLHALLLWAIFLPLGGRWSVDAWRRARRAVPARLGLDLGTVCSPASAAILLQMVLLYVCSGFFKLGNDEWWEGMSLYYVMSFDAYARPAAAWMLQHPDLLAALTWGTVALEIGGPLAAFCPWWTGPIRLAVIASFVAFHLGIELTMTVGLFSWVSLAGWLLFVPPGFWERWAPRQELAAIPAEPATRETGRICPGRVVVGAIVLVLLGFTVYWNATGFRSTDEKRRPQWTRAVMQVTGLRQEWRMFTRPPKHDGWPRAVAKLVGGGEWDLLEDEPGFDWRRRDLPSSMAPNHRWRKFYSVLIGRRHSHLRPYFCRYLAWRFEAAQEAEVQSVRLYQVQEITGAPGEEDRLVRRLLHEESIRSQGAFLDAAEKSDGERFEIHPGI
jgi:hypothetical protein